MPTRLCAQPGCPNPAIYRGRCQAHSTQHNAATHHNKGIYNTHRWRMTRRHVLYHQPLCPCGNIATDVHHLVALKDGGNPYNPANLQALCASCHSQETRREQTSRS